MILGVIVPECWQDEGVWELLSQNDRDASEGGKHHRIGVFGVIKVHGSVVPCQISRQEDNILLAISLVELFKHGID